MREFAKISPQIWINERGKELKRLGLEAQLLAFYLSTNPHANMIGVYYLPIAFIAHETGISTEQVIISLQNLQKIKFCTYDDSSEYIWVHEMAFDQIGSKLKINDNRVKAINDAFHGLPKISFLFEFLEKYAEPFHIISLDSGISEGPLNTLLSKENNNENDNEKSKNKYNEEIESQGINSDDFNFTNKNINENYIKEKTVQDDVREQAVRILDFFNEKTQNSYSITNTNLQIIVNWLNEGYLEKICFQVIACKCRQWKDNHVMKDFLKLKIIFGKKFPKYVNELSKLN